MPTASFTRLALLLIGLLLGACAWTTPAGWPRPVGIHPIQGMISYALSQNDAAIIVLTVPKDSIQNPDPEQPVVGELVEVTPVVSVPVTLDLATLPGAAGLHIDGTVTLDRAFANTLRMTVDQVRGGRSLRVGLLDMSSLLGGPLQGEIRLRDGSTRGEVLVIYVEKTP